jgi:diguanylate cyclase (GGDEF)-like protein
MGKGPNLLRSKFGRRLLALFVGCALGPIALLALLSERHMTRQLENQTRNRLVQANRALGRAIFERLLLLEATLASIPPGAVAELEGPSQPIKEQPVHARNQQVARSNRTQGSRLDGRIALGGIMLGGASGPRKASAPPPLKDPDANQTITAGLDLLARSRFTALEFVDEGIQRTQVFGRLDQMPTLEPDDSAYVWAGETLLLAGDADEGGRARIYMLRRLGWGRGSGIRGTLVGEISPDFLWGTRDQTMPSATSEMAVVDDAGRALFGVAPVPVNASPRILDLARQSASGSINTTIGGAAYLTTYRPIVIQGAFGAPNWTLVLSENQASMLGPMTDFTDTFLFIVGGCTFTVLVLSIIQIRRSLLPLQELQAGTRRIALQDFEGRVALTSRDEFAELGHSFNAMAAQLGRQFKALATAAEIDRTVLSATDASGIVDAVLTRLADVHPCSAASVTLLPPDRSSGAVSWIQHYEGDRSREVIRVNLSQSDLQRLAQVIDVLALHNERELGDLLRPLAAPGAASFIVLPLLAQGQLSGILSIALAAAEPGSSEDLVQARRLADQVAVALSNAGMIEQVRALAYYDSLTGLLNRPSYKERLACALANARREHNQVAVFFLDLDNFGRINDTLGHELGDQLLRQVADRLHCCCAEAAHEREGGPAARGTAVARLGGDEFTVLLPAIEDAEEAPALARRILSAFAAPIQLGMHEVFMTSSIGIALYPADGDDVEMLLAHADTAMYEAKKQGGNGYQVFARAMSASALQRLTLEADLRRALERDELLLHYQPIVHAGSGAIAGAEALVRWQHPGLGLLLPSEFIPIAEENGLIVPLGEWVLRTACAQNRAWQNSGLPPIRVTVNISSRQIRQGTLTTTVRQALEAAGLDPAWLGLELTESVLMERQHEAVTALHRLRGIGVQLSIDDFGTGYSSLSYLKHFPVDTLKIDRTFVRDLMTVPDDAAITAAIIAMAHALELKVVAEGVETHEHLAFLKGQGCDEIQGHLVGRAVTSERFAEWLARSRSPGARLGPAASRINRAAG